MIYGYINPTQTTGKDAQRITNIMQRIGCNIIHKEESEGIDRPKMFYVLNELQENDTIVIPKMNHVLISGTEATLFFCICRAKKVRVISIMDNIDTDGMIYETTPHDVYCMITSFLEDELKVVANSDPTPLSPQGFSMKKHKHKGKPLKSIEQLTIKRQRETRDCKVVNMYNSGMPISKIMELCGFKTKRAVFYILKQNGINTDRCKPNKNRKQQNS